jgi:hypothetical protein
MARPCGCRGGGCQCVLESGDNIVITGIGTEANPFVITGETGDVVEEDLAVWAAQTGDDLVTGLGLARFYFPFAATLLGVSASLGVASAGASVIFDVNKNGTTVFTTQANRPTILAGAYTTATETVPDVVAMAAGDYLTVDRDQVGSSVAGAYGAVTVRYSVP